MPEIPKAGKYEVRATAALRFPDDHQLEPRQNIPGDNQVLRKWFARIEARHTQLKSTRVVEFHERDNRILETVGNENRQDLHDVLKATIRNFVALESNRYLAVPARRGSEVVVNGRCVGSVAPHNAGGDYRVPGESWRMIDDVGHGRCWRKGLRLPLIAPER